MSLQPTKTFDVAVIGAGIVGSAIARMLSGNELSVALLDAKGDVGDGTSKANTAILHTGFDATPGSLESRMVREGYELLSAYAAQTGIPVERTGAILVAWDQEQVEALPALKKKAEKNQYGASFIIDALEVYRQLPHLGEGALAGLVVPDESIICTWTTNLALATEAVQRGTTLLLNHRVTGVSVAGSADAAANNGEPASVLHTNHGDISARWVVNASGLGGDLIDALFGFDRFQITPRRGELLVYDKQARGLVNRIVLPVPTALGKGVLISPTIYGNVMLGPTAEDLTDRSDTATSEKGFEFLLAKGRKLLPKLLESQVTASYAGLRAASNHSDYLIELDAEQRYLLVGGIRSTGLTAAMAVAEYVRQLLESTGLLPLTARKDLPAPPHMPNIGENFLRPYQDAARIKADSAYGTVVCFCERVTAGEIRDTFTSPIPPTTIAGLRRRTRAQNGRCQGFYCGAEVEQMLHSCAGSPAAVNKPTLPAPDLAAQPESILHPAAVIIGGGPAGLRAASEIARGLRANPGLAAGYSCAVLVLERESVAGGIPRHSDHLGYGIRDLGRFLSGPSYAKVLRDRALAQGASIVTQATVTDWADDRSLLVTTPAGRIRVDAGAVVVATGARESPRAARLIPGDRSAGVYNTGQLQNLVHLKHQKVGTRAVIVGAEHVSWSAALTLREVGCATVLMTTEHPKPDSFFVFALLGKIFFRTRVANGTRVTRIIGRGRVEGVEIEHIDTGVRQVIDCDTVILTGGWVPDNELALAGEISINPSSLSPKVDSQFRVSREGVFAIGNLVHPVDTADIAALDGAAVAAPVLDYLRGARPANAHLELTAVSPFRWVCPTVLRREDPFPARRQLLLWSERFVAFPVVTLRQNGAVVARKRVFWPAAPGRVFRVAASILRYVDYSAGEVTIGIDAR